MARRMTDALSNWDVTPSASGSCWDSSEKISDSLLRRHLAASRDFSLRFSDRGVSTLSDVAILAAGRRSFGQKKAMMSHAVSGHCRGLHAGSGVSTMRQMLA
ncbi:unnamed protein product, partial [Ixodes persulcatus]